MNDEFMLGVDYGVLNLEGIKTPVLAPIEGHLIVVGGSGSGKSTAILYWMSKISGAVMYNNQWYIVDFKASKEFVGITEKYAEFEDGIKVIRNFYEEFLKTPEGGDGKIKILFVDEIAGLMTHYSMSKEGRQVADEIRHILSAILMLGRSKKCFIWLAMQRYSASIFPPGSGAADNFHICVGLGRLSPDSRKSLFAGEHFDEEDMLAYGQGRGIVLLDGKPLRGIIIPRTSKQKLLKLLQQGCREPQADGCGSLEPHASLWYQK